MEPKRFEVFCPKLLAGKRNAEIGDTLASRCIFIELKRKTRAEHVDRFRRRDVAGEASALSQALRSLAELHEDALAVARPELPEELADRQQDVWEPLLAIADIAGGEWPERARLAALELSGAILQGDSASILLLADTREAFGNRDRVSTKELIAALTEDEERPWSTWHKGGKPISPRALAGLLELFSISSRTVRFDDDETAKGYMRSSFEDAWSRYLPEIPGLSDTPAQDRSHAGLPGIRSRNAPLLVTDVNELEPASPNGCDVVTGEEGEDWPEEGWLARLLGEDESEDER